MWLSVVWILFLWIAMLLDQPGGQSFSSFGLQSIWALVSVLSGWGFFIRLCCLKLTLLSVEFAKVFFAVTFCGLKRQHFCFMSPITVLPGCLTAIIYLWAPFNHSATQVWSLLEVNLQLHICWNARAQNMEFMSAYTFMCVLHSL